MVTTRGSATIDKGANIPIKASRKRSSPEDIRDLPVREKRRRSSRQQSERDEDVEEEHGLTENPSSEHVDALPQLDGSSETATLPAQSQRKTHIRFGSNSLPPKLPIVTENPPIEVRVEDEDSSDDDDDDEAPEALSISHAEAEVRAAQAEEAKARKLRENEAKEKRRKRDSRLKAQVKDSEKRQSKVEKEKDRPEGQDVSGLQKTAYDLKYLPQLLPDELLAIEAPVRPPTPPPVSKKGNKIGLRARKSLLNDDTPKDLVYKNTNVRVLQSHNTLLPPKAVSEFRTTRESWLRGRAAFEVADRKGRTMSKVKRRSGPQAFV